MGDFDDFVWPPPQSEIDAFEVVDLENGLSGRPAPRVSATAITQIAATRPDLATPIVRSATPKPAPGPAPEFTWPPVGDTPDAIVLVDATLDGGSPWAPSSEQDSLADAATSAAYRSPGGLAAPGWTLWAAVLLVCAVGGAVLERHLHTRLVPVSAAD